ncbi:A24 family peptidase [Anatilimnocola floriformis]|uniref:A24 family peptidase n=1 Tax=Anatilimnocola floriformis TaxID=2948575 RepID=UPI0020C48370|nr:A24 family peptidase [Anatilimnocola floriformis]
MPDLPWLFLLRFIVCILAGCIAVSTDLRDRKIPNWLTLPLLLAGVVFRGSTEFFPGLLDALSGFGVGFGIFLLLWLCRSSAGGDVKFMAAVGVWLGPYHTFVVIVASAVLMLVCMTCLLIGRLFITATATTVGSEGKTNLLSHTVPYALPATLAIVLRLAHLLLIGRSS